MSKLTNASYNTIYSFLQMLLFYVLSLFMGSSIIFWFKYLKKSDIPFNVNNVPYSDGSDKARKSRSSSGGASYTDINNASNFLNVLGMFKGGGRKKRKQRGGNPNYSYTPLNKKPSWFSEKTYGWPYSWNHIRVSPQDGGGFNDWIINPPLNFFGQWCTTIWSKYREWLYNIINIFDASNINSESDIIRFMYFFGAIVLSWTFILLLSPIMTLLSSIYGLFLNQDGIKLGFGFIIFFTIIGWLTMTALNLLPQLLKYIKFLFINPWLGENDDIGKIKDYYLTKGKWLWILLLILTLTINIGSNLDPVIPNLSYIFLGVNLLIYFCLWYGFRFGMNFATDWMF